jgi:LuxR family transcriptional regulator
MGSHDQIVEEYGFAGLAPAGFYIAIRVGFAFPEFEHNALPLGWVHTYARGGLIMGDPVMRWVYMNAGTIRWSDVDIADDQGVLAQAAEFGLTFGVAVSISGDQADGLRSFGTFCRSDREYSDGEMDELSRNLGQLHIDLSPPDDLTEAEIDALDYLNKGMLIKEVAHTIGISEGAVKQRIRSARDKLRARTTAQAVSKARGFGFF